MSEIPNKIYDIKVDKIFIENISFEKVLINSDFLIFAPSRIAYVLIPSSENNTKYEIKKQTQERNWIKIKDFPFRKSLLMYSNFIRFFLPDKKENA